MTTDLVAFLRARLDEDHRIAAVAAGMDAGSSWVADDYDVLGDGTAAEATSFPQAEHIARHDPARVLREVAAKRRILFAHEPVLLRKGSGADYYVTATVCRTCGGTDALYDDGTAPPDRPAAYPCPTLRLLALPYADHPDYQEEWRPE